MFNSYPFCLAESIKRQAAWVCEAFFRCPGLSGVGRLILVAGGSRGQSSDIHHLPPTVQLNNLGQRSLPISVVFWVPTKLNNVTVWDNPQLSFSKVRLAGLEE